MQYERANVGFWGIPDQTIPRNGYIKLIVPDEIFTYTTAEDGGPLECFDVSLALT